jgi:hypothetical protein
MKKVIKIIVSVVISCNTCFSQTSPSGLMYHSYFADTYSLHYNRKFYFFSDQTFILKDAAIPEHGKADLIIYGKWKFLNDTISVLPEILIQGEINGPLTKKKFNYQDSVNFQHFLSLSFSEMKNKDFIPHSLNLISTILPSTKPDDLDQFTLDLKEKIYNAEILTALSGRDLRLLRNTIFARYGLMFKSEDLKNIFSQSGFNLIYTDVSAVLTEIDKINIANILKAEEKISK